MNKNIDEYPKWIQTLISNLSHNSVEWLDLALSHCPESIDDLGMMSIAAKYDNIDALNMLLAAGYSPNHVSNKRIQPPVCAAASNGAFKSMELLINAGADVNETSAPWVPAIVSAMIHKDCNMLEFLIDHGADVNIPFEYGSANIPFTPLSWAEEREEKEFIDLLKKHGAVRVERNTPPAYRNSIPEKDWMIGTVPSTKQDVGDECVLDILGVKYVFRWCPPGNFMMGSPESEYGRENDEALHSVKIKKGFWILDTPVTQKMWYSVMDNNPSWFQNEQFKGNDLATQSFPVESVTWHDAVSFCKELNLIATKLKKPVKFKLPTEAQWEYACRAGTDTAFSFGNVHHGVMDNCNGEYPYGTDIHGPNMGKPVPVRQYAPNAWGLYDLHGNVAEWCEDWYSPDYKHSLSSVLKRANERGDKKVVRGGSFCSEAKAARSASRGSQDPGDCIYDIGFRIIFCSKRVFAF